MCGWIAAAACEPFSSVRAINKLIDTTATRCERAECRQERPVRETAVSESRVRPAISMIRLESLALAY